MSLSQIFAALVVSTRINTFMKSVTQKGKGDLLWTLYVINTFSWGFVLLNTISAFSRTGIIFPSIVNLTAITAYFSAATFSIVGALLHDFSKRYDVILMWTFGGFFLSAFLLFLNVTEIWQATILGVVLGFFASLCLPSILSDLLNFTNYENRGLISGLTFFTIYLIIIIFSILAQFLHAIFLIGLAFWRLIGFYVLTTYGKMCSAQTSTHSSPVVGVSKQHLRHTFNVEKVVRFIMIFLLFSIVDGIQQIFIVRSYGMETLRVIGLIEFGVALPIMVLGGWFIDHYGRRPSYAFSFACVGFAYLTLGALPKCWFLYAILDGIGWALLTVCFILVIWGDIAYGVSRSVYIAICLASALILSGLRDFIAPLVPHYTFLQALAIALFFLFIAAVFVVTAPETLPEEILEARRVKRYIRAALKVKEEFEKRGS